MKTYICAILVTLLLAACQPQQAEQEIAGPSPLAATDPIRLWMLVRASRIGDGRTCSDYFRAPDDLRYRDRAKTCQAWTLNFAEYLHWNGLPSFKSTHLQDPAYWLWFEQMRTQIANCRQRLGSLTGKTTGVQRAEHQQARNACDPWDDARYNQRQSPADLGIRFSALDVPTPFTGLTSKERREKSP